MTENQWPEDPNAVPTANTGIPGERAATTFPAATTPQTPVPGTGDYQSATGTGDYPSGGYQAGNPSGGSKTDAAKAEASDVAGQATSAAKDVAHTAKEEAANVAAEAKTNAKDLMNQAKTGLTSEAGAQQQKAAQGIRNISDQLHSMATAPEQQGVASDLIRQAAERSSSVASWLESREPGDLLGDVQRFARNKPGTFLLLAAGAGVLAGRLTRSLTAGAPEASSGTGTASTTGRHSGGLQYSGTGYGDQYSESYAPAGGTVPPPPVQLPGPATTTAGYDGGAPGSGYPEPVRPASGLDSPQLVEEPWSGNQIADDPVYDRDLADDPMANDPRTRNRSADGESGRF
ncbi:hypothetical protein SAMN04489743_0832 [Pseudarthrobacter equi]|uniref:Uncharacterized protein n=1 Tax=Pseudarthrobacter equi TaxID=728066 RepID=A0A1H1UZ04_9MICC|nr:hypothetical protein [Pseudarthrobacter equi]SDS77693.1 hypothetical protein SAMN04489743_0832 [Pseudarthrobacter equi]